MAVPVIELRSITRVYDGGRVTALADVDLAVAAGQFVAITGRSGSGKTTLLNILGLLDPPTSGTYKLGGVDVSGLSETRRSEIRGRRIGFVFQQSYLISARTSLENVELGLQLAGFPRGRERLGRARAALLSVGLGHRLQAMPPTLSGGERQRVALARALATEPMAILCDEPTGNLDMETGEQVMRLLEAVPGESRCVILVTHEPDLARRAHVVVSLRDGRQVDGRDA